MRKNRAGFLLALILGSLLFAEVVVADEEDHTLRAEPPLRSFDVKATSTHAFFIDGGRIKEEDTGDQVVYFVDLPNKKVKRVAIYYAQKKKDKGNGVISSGLHTDPIEYAVVHYKFDFMRNQLLIKALAQTQNEDGFETLVIGEDFVASTVSTKGYFTVTYYDRTDAEALVYKKREGKMDEDEESSPEEYDYTGPDQTAAEWFSGKFKKMKKLKPWPKKKESQPELADSGAPTNDAWPEPGEVVSAEQEVEGSQESSGIKKNWSDFNRWRRQKVRSSYSD